MNHRTKVKAKTILAFAALLLFILLTYHFEGFARLPNFSFLSSVRDTPPPIISDSSLLKDSVFNKPKNRTPSVSQEKNVADTSLYPVADTFSFKRGKDSLDAPVIYHADDSIVFAVPEKKMYLYGKTSAIRYNENDLAAPLIEYDQTTNLVKAYLTKDSTGKVLNYPYYTQGVGGFQSVSDTIEFNMRTGKGLTKGTYTKQGEMFIYGEKIKKVDTSTFYALRTRFTTCNLDTPHFAFIAKRVKFVNKKWAYTGAVHPEFEGVPMPFFLPFGIFPLTQGRHSGFLAPSFTANDQLGLTLENLGYYKIISPNWDLQVRGSLYSYGSYTINLNPRYYRRYHYTGNIGFALQRIKPLDAGSSKTVNITWAHNADTKSRPGVNFAANVNAGSSKFNSQVPNAPRTNFTNQLNSSITYSKVWKNKPYNISIGANHNQNTVQRLINLNLPDVVFNLNTQYPFRRKEAVGDLKWYENVGIGYNGNAKSLTYFYDTAGHISSQILSNLQYGAVHRIPVTLSLPPLGPVQVSPSVSYEEKWYQQRLTQFYDPAKNALDTAVKKGLYTARQMSFGLSVSTRIFGMYGFKSSSRVKAIRHEIRPQVSIVYSPNFNAKNYYYTTIDNSGKLYQYSYYDGSIYGRYDNNRFGGLTFNIDNNLTMKVRDKSDTAAKADKKISILDGLRLDGSYNFLQDSFKLQPFQLSARTTITDKVNISGNAIFNPYEIDGAGRNIDKLYFLSHPYSLGHLTSGSVSLQSHLDGGKKKDNSSSRNPLINPQNVDASGLPLDEYQREAAYIQNNPGEFVDFEIPWSADISYSLSLNRFYDITKSGFSSLLTQSANFNTSANLSRKWKVGLNGNYDFTLKKIQTVSLFLSRDLHCWQMSINVSPVGIYKFFSINISPKSSILRDLKINRTRSFYDYN